MQSLIKAGDCVYARLFTFTFFFLSCHDLVFFQRAVFQGLSQEALSACIQSLLKASDIILKNKVGTQKYFVFLLKFQICSAVIIAG